MDFQLSEHHQLIRDNIREVVQREIIPLAPAWDREERFPWEGVRKLADLGIMGIMVPEEYGGAGLDFLSAVLIIEEIAAGDGSLALTVSSHNGLCIGHILLAGDPDQKRKYLPDLAAGRKLGCWALTEPGSGSDAGSMRSTARRDGDHWVLNGSKIFATQGSVADVYVVLALSSPDKKQKGVTAFIVEKGTPGLVVGRKMEKLGMHASDTTELSFDNCVVPDENRLGAVDTGFAATLRILDRGRITIAALAIGLGRGALDAARRYARERTQFGKPIGDYQAIQWMIADAATELDAARLLTLRAAFLQEEGKRSTLESSQAKLFAAQAAMKACNSAIQIHGGYGYTREFPVERYFRDAKLCEIGEGTNEIQKIIIARHIVGREGNEA
jgi:alkylation response protein AidB-like acyl-CoA dehydrogenase